MDKEDARLALQAYRPNGHDTAHPVMAEALACVESDPELKAWWKAQHEFDRKVAAKLEAVPIPADLRATILSGRKIEKLTPRRHLPYWLAAAALFAILAVISLHPWTSSSPLATNKMPSRDYTAAIAQFLDNDPSLGLVAHDHDKILAWLQQQHAPTGKIPATMTDISSLGCQKLTIHGHTVSFICFSLADGGIVHLFIMDQQGLTDPPGPTPHYGQSGDWSTALWSDGKNSYLLTTQSGPDVLKHLL